MPDQFFQELPQVLPGRTTLASQYVVQDLWHQHCLGADLKCTNLGLSLDPQSQNLHFNRNTRRSVCPFKFEKLWFITLEV